MIANMNKNQLNEQEQEHVIIDNIIEECDRKRDKSTNNIIITKIALSLASV
jgi:hypothetical protein